MFEGERRFDITVRYHARGAHRHDRYRQHPGAHARWRPRSAFSDWPHIKVVNGASIIARRENRRQITVRTNIRGRDQGSFVADAQARFDAGSQTAPRLQRRVGRPVREPRTGAQAADRDSADHDRHHLCAAVLRLRIDRATPAW